MSKLAPFLTRKAEAIAARQADWTGTPGTSVISVKASSKVAGITGARPTRMGEMTIVSDSAPGLAGHALGPTAPEMLMGALASCLVHTYLIQATLMEVPLDDVQIEVTGTLDMAGVVGLPVTTPPRIDPITYHAHVETSATAEQIAALHAAVEDTCPVLFTLRLPVTVNRT